MATTGSTWIAASAAIVASLDAGVPEADDDRARAGTTLRTAGRTLISTVGGASGSALRHVVHEGRRTRSSVPIRRLAPGEIVLAALEAAIGGIQSLGKATTGEKTMLDVLVPALEAGRAAQAAGADLTALTAAMADAADAGVQATIPMLATKGRASYLGERSIGHQDPGATSASALLLRTLADVVAADGPG